MYETIKAKKEREAKCKEAISKWKKHCDALTEKLKEQEMELINLRPTKAKSQKFVELCREYHRATKKVEQSKLICRETQTNECRLDNNNNKENIGNNHNKRKKRVTFDNKLI